MQCDMERVLKKLQDGDPLVHLFTGDSITHGNSATHFHRDYTQLYSEFVRGRALGRNKDVIINTGVAGRTTRSLLQNVDLQVVRFRPDLVFLMIGMNDCREKNDISIEEFSANLRELTQRFRDIGALTILQTTTPIIPNSCATDREPFLPAFMDVVRLIAEEEDLPLVDHHNHWLELENFPYNWMEDSYHPNEWGHMAMARFLVTSIGLQKPENPLFSFPLR